MENLLPSSKTFEEIHQKSAPHQQWQPERSFIPRDAATPAHLSGLIEPLLGPEGKEEDAKDWLGDDKLRKMDVGNLLFKHKTELKLEYLENKKLQSVSDFSYAFITAAANDGIILKRHYVHWHCSPTRRSASC